MTVQPSPIQLTALQSRALMIIATHPAKIAATCVALGTDFNTPAQRTINRFFEDANCSRFTKDGDDLWDMIRAIRSGEPDSYYRPSRELVRRWSMA